jgi:TolB-like protein
MRKYMRCIAVITLLCVSFVTPGCTKSVRVQQDEIISKLPEYKIEEPYFPDSKSKMRLAILPFTDSVTNDQSKGLEISGEIESELMKRESGYPSGEYCGFTMQDMDNYYLKNKHKKYKFIKRKHISDVINENEISSLSTETIKKLRDIRKVDALLTGHVTRADSGRLSFIMNAIDARTSKVVFSDSFEGEHSEAIRNAVDSFYYNIKKTGDDCEKITYSTTGTKISQVIEGLAVVVLLGFYAFSSLLGAFL